MSLDEWPLGFRSDVNNISMSLTYSFFILSALIGSEDIWEKYVKVGWICSLAITTLLFGHVLNIGNIPSHNPPCTILLR